MFFCNMTLHVTCNRVTSESPKDSLCLSECENICIDETVQNIYYPRVYNRFIWRWAFDAAILH